MTTLKIYRFQVAGIGLIKIHAVNYGEALRQLAGLYSQVTFH